LASRVLGLHCCVETSSGRRGPSLRVKQGWGCWSSRGRARRVTACEHLRLSSEPVGLPCDRDLQEACMAGDARGTQPLKVHQAASDKLLSDAHADLTNAVPVLVQPFLFLVEQGTRCALAACASRVEAAANMKRLDSWLPGSLLTWRRQELLHATTAPPKRPRIPA